MRTGSLVVRVGFVVLPSLGLVACGGTQESPTVDPSSTSAAPPASSPTASSFPTASATSAPSTSATPAASTPPPASGAPTASSAPGRKLSKEGEICGGIAGFQCEAGLVCSMTKPAYPDQAGQCQKAK